MCELAELIMANIEPVPMAGCWLWSRAWGGVGQQAYGRAWVRGRGKIDAHRLAYEVFKGPIPAGMMVCHTCDTPPCVNPDHLFLGTCKDNVTDMLRKHRRPIREKKRTIVPCGPYRGGWRRGERNVNAKLTAEQVCEIRSHAAPFPYNEYVQRFGVARSTIWYARSGARWRGV